jgi:Domain of unknown function (DUF6438)
MRVFWSAAKVKVVLWEALLLCGTQAAIADGLQIAEVRFDSKTGYSQDRFTLEVRSDGMVEYLGKNSVDVKGKRTAQISRTDFNKLVRKIQEIRFFQLNDRYDRFPLDDETESHGDVAVTEKTIVTDQPTQIVTVVAKNRIKTVEDYMGPPKGLRDLEDLIVDITGASRWIGRSEDLHDVPYYESFPRNKEVTFRALLEHYSSSGGTRRLGYLLMLMKNNGVDFYVKAPDDINISQFDGYIVDATGYIKQTPTMGHIFVVTDIQPVRRYIEMENQKH